MRQELLDVELSSACEAGEIDEVIRLLADGANPFAFRDEAFDLAVKNCHVDVMHILIEARMKSAAGMRNME